MQISGKHDNIKHLEVRGAERVTIENYSPFNCTLTIEENGLLHFFKVVPTLGGVKLVKEKMVEVARVRRKPKIQAAAPVSR